MTFLLNKRNLVHLPIGIKKPTVTTKESNGILHFGVGGFHRAHQAYIIQKLIDMNPEKYAFWTICGACILPQDEVFVKKMKNQDFLYTLKSSSSGGEEEIRIISSISNVLGPNEHQEIIDRIASKETKIVSFTITEGGYMIDENSGEFKLDHPDIVSDLHTGNVPRTVFGYLARGMAKRRETGAGKIIFLSCDNVLENGQVLQKAFLAFLMEFDPELKGYVSKNVSFPNSMVDRITPATTSKDKDDFEKELGYRDECLVVSEDFSQWIIEETDLENFPPLKAVGMTFVKDVRPYEQMKLKILNGGHSLIGLVGGALGYNYIHEAIKNTLISQLYDLYIEEEAIPSLIKLEGVDYLEYTRKVKSRFGNELIKDSTDRIISFSSAKIPKFILPVLRHSVSTNGVSLISSLIIAAWWHYLDQRIGNGREGEIEDALKDQWLFLFKSSGGNSAEAFLHEKEVFGELGSLPKVQEQIIKLVGMIETEGMEKTCEFVLDSVQN